MTTCKRGHPRTPENTRYDSRGYRVCKACKTHNKREARGTPAPSDTDIWRQNCERADREFRLALLRYIDRHHPRAA
jgi:hypothetical protein